MLPGNSQLATLIIIHTTGDKVQDRALAEIGGKQYSQSILVRVAEAQRNQAEAARKLAEETMADVREAMGLKYD